MEHKRTGLLIIVYLHCLFISSAFGQAAIPPDSIKINIVEALGNGCHNVSNNAGGILCFDVYLEIDQPGWVLQAYQVWMNYGENNNVLTYESDLSCYHSDGGDIASLDPLGKYRFLAANDSLNLAVDQPNLIHNFCMDVVMFSSLNNHTVIPGGDYFNLATSMNLIDINNSSNAISVLIPRGDTFSLNQSSFLTIDPVGEVVCDYPNIYLSAYPEDASGSSVIDCEPFQLEWTGPNGFVSPVADTIISIVDPVNQSGLYELTIIGSNGCSGYDSYLVDIEVCSLEAIPPDPVTVSIVESVGAGCHRTSNHVDGQICFDVLLKVNQPGWALKSYVIWMDYGGRFDSVLHYAYDSACLATSEIFDDINLDQFGKYRFQSRYTYNDGFFYLPENQDVNFHNFCLDINSFADLENWTVTPGGDHFSLFSQMQLVDQLDTLNSINYMIPSGEPFELNKSSFLIIDPVASADCNTSFLKLTSLAEDPSGTSVIDCESFQYLWIGPDSFNSIDSALVIPITDPLTQSGVYQLFVTGENGCKGHTSFNVNLVDCEIVQCEDVIILNGSLNLNASLQARIEIISEGDIEIVDDLLFDAPAISLMPYFEVPLGVDFETSSIGCP